MDKLILGVEIFIFIMCILNIIKNLYTFFKVLHLKEGHVDNSTLSTIIFGCSISYFITILIIGF